ncbi:MAG: hypothetical protein CMA98_03785 [Euryarchaeota archaeon]|jgi:hypothetical protein|nr:hypothetical protein [Euryarchaeota archaeon]MDP6328549.1 hypothetical protein [Candidatus Thalassarchaeaceae archaeon]|tara:strand:+ start:603 stop:1076 length:474 start_codon:yes stop_codon:yes gene_type:complete
MVNLFKLLGLPDPKKNVVNDTRTKNQSSANPGPRSSSRADFHDLGDPLWSERTERLIPQAQKNVVYLKPDKYQRVQLEGMENEIRKGSMILVDLTSLSHMPTQKDVCKRRVESLGEINNIPVFSLNQNDSLLMIPGLGMRVDTKKHRLGMKALEHES